MFAQPIGVFCRVFCQNRQSDSLCFYPTGKLSQKTPNRPPVCFADQNQIFRLGESFFAAGPGPNFAAV
jgi:hypothetical protein